MSEKYQVVAVSGHFGGLYEIGYWTLPEVKSGWVPLASVYGSDPDSPAVQAVVNSLQAVVNQEPQTVEVVIGVRNGLWEQTKVYRNPKRASREADGLQKEYGITAADGAGVEKLDVVIHMASVIIIEGE